MVLPFAVYCVFICKWCLFLSRPSYLTQYHHLHELGGMSAVGNHEEVLDFTFAFIHDWTLSHSLNYGF